VLSEAEMLAGICRYFEMPDTKRLDEKERMTRLVADKSDIQNTIQAVRNVIEQAGAAWQAPEASRR
ncbi:MAG TPA: hypothetical protein VN363_04240, partial [Anaerolineales bacterium]|nr:hypothetical protein [Anaerolineales bacterium]